MAEKQVNLFSHDEEHNTDSTEDPFASLNSLLQSPMRKMKASPPTPVAAKAAPARDDERGKKIGVGNARSPGDSPKKSDDANGGHVSPLRGGQNPCIESPTDFILYNNDDDDRYDDETKTMGDDYKNDASRGLFPDSHRNNNDKNIHGKRKREKQRVSPARRKSFVARGWESEAETKHQKKRSTKVVQTDSLVGSR